MSLRQTLFLMMVLKSKPQDIEYNLNYCATAVLLYLISGTLLLSESTEFDIAIYSMVLDVVVLALFSVGCLVLLQLKARWLQTLTALFGTGIIYHALAWPLIERLSLNDISDSNKSTLSLVFLLLLSWQVLVNAHIYRHALSINMTKAVVLSIAYWLMSVTVSQIIFPAA